MESEKKKDGASIESNKRLPYNNGHYTIIHAQEMEEMDVLGGLLELYIEGARYHKEKATLTIPKDVYKQLIMDDKEDCIAVDKKEES